MTLTIDGVEYWQARSLVGFERGVWTFEGSVASDACPYCGRADFGPAQVRDLSEAVAQKWLIPLARCSTCRHEPPSPTGGAGATVWEMAGDGTLTFHDIACAARR